MAIRIYGKRLIQTPPGLATRPTSAKVREAVFNMWQTRVPNARWLDLCAGSGSMGAEALARGAREVIGIERDSKACRIIQSNWQTIATPSQQFSVMRGDVRSSLKKLSPSFDLVYFDPPYKAKLYHSVLSQLIRLDLLAEDGLIVAEHGRDMLLTESIRDLDAIKSHHYGQTSVTFFKKARSSDRRGESISSK